MTTEFPSASLEQTADAIAGHGLRSVQLQLGSLFPDVPLEDALLRGLDVLGDRVTGEHASRARSVLAERGIAVAAVDGTYNMVHTDVERRNRNLRRLVRLIELAPLFGSPIVTLCTGTRADIMWRWHEDNQTEAAWQDLVEQLRVASAAAQEAGVILAFEPEFNNVVDSARRARRLLDEVGSDAVKVLMDGANLFHTGDLARQHDHLQAAFDLIGADIALAHAKDLDHDGDAGARAAGQGLLDYGTYLNELQRVGYDGPIVLHQTKELAPDRVDEAFRHVAERAPAGYLR